MERDFRVERQSACCMLTFEGGLSRLGIRSLAPGGRGDVHAGGVCLMTFVSCAKQSTESTSRSLARELSRSQRSEARGCGGCLRRPTRARIVGSCPRVRHHLPRQPRREASRRVATLPLQVPLHLA